MEDIDNICNICYDTFDDNDDNDSYKLICNHVFHYDCIIEAFLNNKKNNINNLQCPYCRNYSNMLSLKSGIIPIKGIHKEYNDIAGLEIDIITLINFYNLKMIPHKCVMIIKKGENKGRQCCRNIFEDTKFCKLHLRSNKYIQFHN